MTNSPYDIDMMHFIESVTGHFPEVLSINVDEQFEPLIQYSWPVISDKDRQKALENGLKGMLGERFHQVEYGLTYSVLYFHPDKRVYPNEYRYDYTNPETDHAEKYERRDTKEVVSGVLFNKINIDSVVRFTGGGIYIEPENSESYKEYIFPKETGHFLKVQENEWIIFSNGSYYKMTLTEFSKTFKKHII